MGMMDDCKARQWDGLFRNCLENLATIGKNFTLVSIQKPTDDWKALQWDGLPKRSFSAFIIHNSLLIVLMLFLSPFLLYPQRYLCQTYSLKDGLLNPTIFDITQDNNGHMWFATAREISCYDGSTWKNYSEADGLPNIGYFKIWADKDGNIWAITRNMKDGISFRDAQSRQWHHFDGPPGAAETADNASNKEPVAITSAALLEDRDTIYIGIGTNIGFFIFYKNKTFCHGRTRTNTDNSQSLFLRVPSCNFVAKIKMDRNSLGTFVANRLRDLCALCGKSFNYYYKGTWTHGFPRTVWGVKPVDGKFCLATEEGIYLVDPSAPLQWEALPVKTPTPDIYSLALEKIPQQRNGEGDRLWVIGSNWVGYCEPFPHDTRFHLLYQGDLPQMEPGLPINRLSILPDRFGGVWLSNRDYFLNIDREGQLKILGIHENLRARGAYALFYDRESNLWVGTFRGIMKITNFCFENYRGLDGLYDDEVSAAAELSPGQMVFGHNGGFTFVNTRENSIHTLEIPGSRKKFFLFTRVLDMCRDKEGYTWASASRLGIARISPAKQVRWYSVDAKPGKLQEKYYGSVVCDAGGDIYAGVDNQVYRFDRKTQGLVRVDSLEKDEGYIRRLFVDRYRPGIIYVTALGRNFYQLKKNKIEKILVMEPKETTSIYAVYPDKDGNLLLGTDGGLYVFSPGKGSMWKFQYNSFRVDQPVYFITEDHSGNLWIGLNSGVICWDGRQARYYTMDDGLAGYETNRGAGMVDSNGRIWIGTERGISCYYKERDRASRVPPLVELLYLEVAGQPGQVPLHRDLEFDFHHDDLTFYFRGVSFINEGAVNYNLKLEGYDHQWRTGYRAQSNQIRYHNVPPGSYRFMVQAVNSLGINSNILSSGVITIKSPFYRTWWFYSLLLAVIVLLVFLTVNFFTKKRYADLLEDRIQERTRQLKESEREFRDIFNNAHDAILIFDPSNEVILEANKRGCEIYGFPPSEFIGMSLESISKNVSRGKQRIEETLRAGDCYSFETVQYRKDGSEMFLEVNASVIDYKGKAAILSLNRDITGRKRAEEQIKKSLKEKELLLKEIHHRVKNNLQVISSLLDLQSDTLKDEEILKTFQGSKDRIRSMALIHENLYQFGDLARIDGIEYVRNLTAYLFETYGGRARNVTSDVRIEASSMALDMDIAVPIGLLLTEIISNALKHAFPSGRPGEIQITLRSLKPETLTLEVKDNGVGFPRDIDFEETQTLGMQLITLLARQVKGTLEIKREAGTAIIVTFPYAEPGTEGS